MENLTKTSLIGASLWEKLDILSYPNQFQAKNIADIRNHRGKFDKQNRIVALLNDTEPEEVLILVDNVRITTTEFTKKGNMWTIEDESDYLVVYWSADNNEDYGRMKSQTPSGVAFDNGFRSGDMVSKVTLWYHKDHDIFVVNAIYDDEKGNTKSPKKRRLVRSVIPKPPRGELCPVM